MLIKNIIAETEPPLTGKLIFYQNQLPPLSSDTSGDLEDGGPIPGSYTLTVEQTVSSAGGEVPETTYQNINNFTVIGPRFSLPNEISSFYPPEVEGEYGNVLPHVCFKRATLPWERGAGTKSSDIDADVTPDVAPWLGILLLYATDPAVTFTQVTLNELMTPTLPPNTFYPAFELEYGEKLTDPCAVMDIPIALFNKIAPSYTDLPWLAHVREVKPSTQQSARYLNKLKEISTETTTPKLSTVVCNRLPIKGALSTACVVSFENWAKYLPDDNGGQSTEIPAGTTTIRMVLLKSWQFTAETQDQTFSGYLLNLNKKDGEFTGGLLQLRPDNGTTEADKAINNAFNMGFVPLNHHTRQGDNTVSWYKGPFLPFNVGGEINIPVLGPDSVTAYNPDTGMFDVSYAAAWQLGRLLALQNGNFAETLYNWKRENTQTIISNFEEEIIKKTLKEIVDDEKNNNDNDNLTKLMNKSLSKVLSQFITHKNGHHATEIK